MENKGIVETKQALEGILELSIVLAYVLKDGAQITDLLSVWEKVQNDPNVKQKVMAAFSEISKVPDEVRDLDVAEIVELVSTMLPFVTRLILALRKK